MDPGVRLLELITERVAAGETHFAAERRVFSENPSLVARWHAGEAGERPEPQRREEPTMVDPGQVLLELVGAYERNGVDRATAQHMVMRRHPHVAAAYDAGRMIPKAPARPMLPATRQRQLWSSQDALRRGEVLCHKLADPTAGGGWFAVMGA